MPAVTTALRLLIAAASLAKPCLAQVPLRSGGSVAPLGVAGRPLFGGLASMDTLRNLESNNPEHQRLMAPLVQSATLLPPEAAVGGALDFGIVVSKAAQLVEAQMQESLAAGDLEELSELGAIAAQYRPQDAEAFNSAYARMQAAKDLAARMAAELAVSAPPATEPAAFGEGTGVTLEREAFAAIRREMTERATLAPSLVQQYMARVYNSYPEHDSRAAYARYIEPLRDARAKRMLHALLIYSSGNPERMRPLPYEQAREHLVEAANRLSAGHDPEDLAGLSAAIGLYAAELDDLRSRLAPSTARESAAPPEAPPTLRRQTSDLVPSAELDYFPGWPELSDQYRDLLSVGRMRLVKDEKPSQRPHDEEVYQVYIGAESVGRFTIRRYADRVERNVLFMYDGRMVSFGRSDGPVDDWIRRTQQQAERLWDGIKRLIAIRPR